MKTITATLSTSGIDKLICELDKYAEWVKTKANELTEKLAYVGVREASVRFASAMYDGSNDVSVSLVPIENGYSIQADGQAVCFIEYGAGVYYNGSEPYPNQRPAGVVGIGEYGYGLGKRDSWYFNRGGEKTVTHGTPAAMPMWYATKEMEEKLLTVAREVFAS
jgi:hypothetical protein